MLRLRVPRQSRQRLVQDLEVSEGQLSSDRLDVALGAGRVLDPRHIRIGEDPMNGVCLPDVPEKLVAPPSALRRAVHQSAMPMKRTDGGMIFSYPYSLASTANCRSATSTTPTLDSIVANG